MLALTRLHHLFTAEVIAGDPDAIDRFARRRDLGVPDGVWWAITVIGGWSIVWALLLPIRGVAGFLGAAVVPAVFAGLYMGVFAFAYRRWGQQQFRLRRALSDGLWTAIVMGVGALLMRLLDFV